MANPIFTKCMEDVVLLADHITDAVSAREIDHEERPAPDDLEYAVALRERATELVMLARKETREQVEVWLESARENK